MKRVLADTNILLDVLLDRKPHSTASAAVWAAVETGRLEGFVSAHAISTIHYLVQKLDGAARARRTVSAVLQVFKVALVDELVIRQALQLAWPDFEDAVTSAAADRNGCDALVTHDPKGFPASPVRVFTPESVVASLAQS